MPISLRSAGLLACAAISFALTASAATYRVGVRPYLTLQTLLDARPLEPGDIVEVLGGATYPGGLTISAFGTAEQPIVIRGLIENGKRPRLSGVGKGGAVLKVVGGHVLIEGFDITAGGDPHAFRGFYAVGDDIALRDSVVHDCKCTGVSGSDSSGSLTLDGVEVFRCGAGEFAHQIYVGSGAAAHPDAVFRMTHCYVHDGLGGNNVKSRVTRNDIYYNWIEGAAFHELDLVGPDPKANPGVSPHCDSDVVGNVFVKTATAHGTLARLGSDGTGDSDGHYRFVNNTVIVRSSLAAGFGLFWVRGKIESFGVCNNVFWLDPAIKSPLLNVMPAAPGFMLKGGGNWTPAGARNVPAAWVAAVTGDPAFANPSHDWFWPRAGSALEGTGVVPHDVLGEADLPDALWPPASEPSNQPGAAAARPPRTPTDVGAYAIRR